MEILGVDKRIDPVEGPINRTTFSVSMASGLVNRMEEYVKDGPKQVHGSVDDFVDFAIRDKLEQLDRKGKNLNFSEMNTESCLRVNLDEMELEQEVGSHIVQTNIESMEIRQSVNGVDYPLVKLTFEISADQSTDEIYSFIEDWFCDFKEKASKLVHDRMGKQ